MNKECSDCFFIETVILDFIEGTGNDTRPTITCKCGKKFESSDNEYTKGHKGRILDNKNFTENVAKTTACWLDAGNTDTMLVVNDDLAIIIHAFKKNKDKTKIKMHLGKQVDNIMKLNED